jgi:hypothetical protein
MWKICLFIGLLAILTACNKNVQFGESKTPPSDQPGPTASPTSSPKATPTTSPMDLKSSFPSSVDLSFKPLQMDQLKEDKPKKEWALTKEIPFGEVKQQKIVLDIYQETINMNNSTAKIHAMVQFNNTFYLIQDELMEIPTVEHSTMYLLQHKLSDKFILLGGIELFANGPGRIAYIVYDIVHDKWLTFENWGKPQFVDLDSDGEDEFVIQFEGLHSSFPDLTIYTWYKGNIEGSESVKSAVMGRSVAGYAKLGIDKKITISTVKEDALAKFAYDKGRLLKQ